MSEVGEQSDGTPSFSLPAPEKGETGMNRPMRVGLCLELLAASALVASAAAINLNSSKSNVYRVTYHSDVATDAQIRAMLAELDKVRTMDEARLKQWLPANFRRFGIDAAKVRKTVILPPGEAGTETAILLLSNPADEAQARATSVKSSKSNSSD